MEIKLHQSPTSSLRNMLLDNGLEVTALAVFTFGCIFDHLTTAYGLTQPNIMETNINVLFLIENNLWHLLETLVVAAGVLSGILIVRGESNSIMRYLIIAQFVVGITRLYAGFHNISVIFN